MCAACQQMKTYFEVEQIFCQMQGKRSHEMALFVENKQVQIKKVGQGTSGPPVDHGEQELKNNNLLKLYNNFCREGGGGVEPRK